VSRVAHGRCAAVSNKQVSGTPLQQIANAEVLIALLQRQNSHPASAGRDSADRGRRVRIRAPAPQLFGVLPDLTKGEWHGTLG